MDQEPPADGISMVQWCLAIGYYFIVKKSLLNSYASKIENLGQLRGPGPLM